jgi:hypothetical protein
MRGGDFFLKSEIGISIASLKKELEDAVSLRTTLFVIWQISKCEGEDSTRISIIKEICESILPEPEDSQTDDDK